MDQSPNRLVAVQVIAELKMSIPKQCPIKVLLFSSEPSLGGGVAAFDELFRRKLSASIQAEQFLAGRRPGFFGRTFRAVVPFYDAIRLAWLLTVRRHDVYHLNPSLVPRAIIRDGLFLLVLRLFRRRQVLVLAFARHVTKKITIEHGRNCVNPVTLDSERCEIFWKSGRENQHSCSEPVY